MGKYQDYTRRELYDLVWARPMVKLAGEFGLSDVGLRKICAKHGIPKPPRGYWAKLNFGKPVKRSPLGSPGKGVSDRVLFSVFTPVEVPDEIAEAAIKARDRIQAAIVVPNDPPNRFHPFAQALRRALRSAKPDDEGFLRVSGSGILSAAIGPANRDRTILLADTLFKALEEVGEQIETTKDGLNAVVDGEAMAFRFGETKDRSELKAKFDCQARQKKGPSLYDTDRQHWRTSYYFPSGRLSLTLIDPVKSR